MPKNRIDRADALHCMPVAEKFVSINGEGPRAGLPAAFIRFVGCNLKCSYCDTAWACDKKCECENLDAWQLCEWVANTRMHAVTLTGGEPLLHPMMGNLLRMLVRGSGTRDVPFELPQDLTVEIESNGSISLQKLFTLLNFLPAQQSSRIHFTLDYKLPSSGEEAQMCKSNYALLRAQDAVKFVVSDLQDMQRAAAVGRELDLFGRVPVFFSPVFGSIEPADIAKFLIENHLTAARVQIQLHKLLWPGTSRGV